MSIHNFLRNFLREDDSLSFSIFLQFIKNKKGKLIFQRWSQDFRPWGEMLQYWNEILIRNYYNTVSFKNNRFFNNFNKSFYYIYKNTGLISHIIYFIFVRLDYAWWFIFFIIELILFLTIKNHNTVLVYTS